MSCKGTFNYLSPSTEPSLYRNGKLFTKRGPDGSDGENVGLKTEKVEKTILDARKHSMTIDQNGFQLVEDDSTSGVDYMDSNDVIANAYPAAAALVKRIVGARKVVAFDHNVRSAGGSSTPLKNGQAVQGPARIVHADYTLRSAPERLHQLTLAPSGSDTLATHTSEPLLDEKDLEGRCGIINVWRNIAREPVARDPFAFIDAQTVSTEDFSVFEIHYSHRIGENYFGRDAKDRHQWYFYPEAKREEAILLKTWDSKGRIAVSKGKDNDDSTSPCTFTLHSAFENDAPEDAPERWSCEIRCAVIY